MKGLLFTGGAAPLIQHITKELEDADLIVAADSGFDTAVKLGIVPDIVIGDMDSINDSSVFEKFSDLQILNYPEDKDKSDTELGIMLLKDKKMDKIILIGGGSGRMDHFLDIVFLFERENSPDIWYTDNTRFVKINGYSEFSGMSGRIVSFFPCGINRCRVVTRGLKWELDNLVWKKGDMSLSNVVVADPFTVDVLRGELIMINQLEDDSF